MFYRFMIDLGSLFCNFVTLIDGSDVVLGTLFKQSLANVFFLRFVRSERPRPNIIFKRIIFLPRILASPIVDLPRSAVIEQDQLDQPNARQA